MKQLYKIIGEAILVSPLFVISIFLDLWSECIVIIALLFIYKSFYSLQYHAETNKLCIVISYLTVISGLIIAYVFKKEYILIVILDNMVAYAGARIGIMQRKAKQYELIAEPYAELVEFYNTVKAKEKSQKEHFNVDEATEEELIARCKELHFSEKNIELAIEFFIKKTKHEIIANKLRSYEKSVTMRKARMKKKLNY